jgi:hypothetical protein
MESFLSGRSPSAVLFNPDFSDDISRFLETDPSLITFSLRDLENTPVPFE